MLHGGRACQAPTTLRICFPYLDRCEYVTLAMKRLSTVRDGSEPNGLQDILLYLVCIVWPCLFLCFTGLSVVK